MKLRTRWCYMALWVGRRLTGMANVLIAASQMLNDYVRRYSG